jgi:hypothetical protein
MKIISFFLFWIFYLEIKNQSTRDFLILTHFVIVIEKREERKKMVERWERGGRGRGRGHFSRNRQFLFCFFFLLSESEPLAS